MANIVDSVGETSHNVVCMCVSVCIGGQRKTVTCSLCLSVMVSWRFEVEKLNQIFLHFTVMSVMGEQVMQIVKLLWNLYVLVKSLPPVLYGK